MAGKFRFRPMLIGELAKAAGEPRETIRTRLKKGVFGLERPSGWKRFTDFEAICICVHAKLMKVTRDPDLALLGYLKTSEALLNDAIEGETGRYFRMSTFDQTRFMLFWRSAEGVWDARIYGDESEFHWALRASIDGSYRGTPSFTFVNLQVILLEVISALATVLEENGE